MTGKFINQENEKTFTIHIFNDVLYKQLSDKNRDNETFSFIGCPVIEYGSFDPNAGDVYALEVL